MGCGSLTMKYNLIRSSATVVNLTEGNTDLTINELLATADNEGTPVTTLSGGSILCLDTDLGSRISLYELQYYFGSSASKAATASGIEFFYKNESFDTYVSLVTTYTGSGNLYNATTTSGLFAPRYIRMKHTTNVSGTLYGYEILNNDDVVDFGTDGTLTSATVAVSRNYGLDIREIPIYNSGANLADAIVLIEPQNTNVDYILSVSNDDEGPWYGTHTHELMSATAGTWNNGNLVSTTTTHQDALLVIDGESDTGAFAVPFSAQGGEYETMIFQNDSTKLNYARVLVNNRDAGMRVTNNLTDSSDTIAVRSSSYTPEPYSTYLKLYDIHVGDNDYVVRVADYWRKTGALISESGNKSPEYRRPRLNNYKLYIDQSTGNYGGFYYMKSSSYNSYLVLFSCIDNGSFSTDNVSYRSSDYITHNQYKSKMNSNGDQWFYFYCLAYDSGYEVDADGYYLMCYDESMTKEFKYYRTINYMADFDVVYDDRSVWVADKDGIQLKHFDFDGTILGIYNSTGKTDNLTSVSVDNRDKSVWFSNGMDLHRISETGAYMDFIENVGTTLITQIELALDDNDEMWVLEDSTIKRIVVQGDVPGKVLYEVTVSSAIEMTPTMNGVWVDRSDDKISYIQHSSERIETTIDDELYLGYLEYNYDDGRYATQAPLSIDSVWSNLTWQEVILPEHTLSEDHYQQLKITLQKPIPSSNYNVSDDEVWQVNDSFVQASGTAVNDQRWAYNYSTEFTGSALRLLRSEESRITSENRFYVKDDFDIRVKYELPDGPPTSGGIYLWIKVQPLDVTAGATGLRLYLTHAGSTSTYRAYVNGGVDDTNNISPISTYYKSELRLRLDTSNEMLYAYVKNPTTGLWLTASDRAGATTAVIGRRFYIDMYIESSAVGDVDLTDFDVSSNTDSDNIYNYCSITPQVTDIFTQQAVQVYDIHPNTSKNAYLKTEISAALDLVSDYDSDLRVRWRTPVE